MKKGKSFMMLTSNLLALTLVVSSTNAAVHDYGKNGNTEAGIEKLSHQQTLNEQEKKEMKRKSLLLILKDVSCDGSVG